MKLEMLVGNVGSGKSFLASKLAKKGSVVINMDQIQEMLSGGVYGAYDPAKKEIYHKIEETAIESSFQSGISVCIDRTNIDKKRRERFINIAKKYTDEIICYDFGPDKGLERRLLIPRDIPKSMWHYVFNNMRKYYEKPDISEGFSEIIIPPERYEFYAFDFDGTIVKNNFPDIGEIIDGTVSKINDLFQDLKNVIIIWSCRSGDYQAQMNDFLIKQKIPFDFINENPLFNTSGKKIFAHKYFDDRNAFSDEILYHVSEGIK